MLAELVEVVIGVDTHKTWSQTPSQRDVGG